MASSEALAQSSASPSTTSSNSGEGKSNTINLQTLLSACYDLAERSGEIIRDVFASGKLGIIDKSVTEGEAKTDTPGAPKLARAASKFLRESLESDDFDPQTVADVAAQRMIIGSLRKAFPGLHVIGEEGDLTINEDDIKSDLKLDLLKQASFPSELLSLPIDELAVWVDPMDATKEFTLGIKEAVTVLIGVSRKEKAIGGIIHVPFLARTVWGAPGVGAFGYKREEIPAGRRWITTSRSHMTEDLKSIIDKLKVGKLIQQGGAGNKGLLVLEGKADVYFFPQDGTKRWDTCAVDAVMHAVGANVTDAYGDPIDYSINLPYNNKTGVLATLTPEMHKEFTIPKGSPLPKI